MKFSIKDFLSKCFQIRRKLWICSHLLKKSLKLHFLCSDCPEAYLGPYQRSMMLFFENWSLNFRIYLRFIIYCSHKGFYDRTVYNNTNSSYCLTHWPVYTFLVLAVWWLCRFNLNLILRDVVNYIRFDQLFRLTTYLMYLSLQHFQKCSPVRVLLKRYY